MRRNVGGCGESCGQQNLVYEIVQFLLVRPINPFLNGTNRVPASRTMIGQVFAQAVYGQARGRSVVCEGITAHELPLCLTNALAATPEPNWFYCFDGLLFRSSIQKTQLADRETDCLYCSTPCYAA